MPTAAGNLQIERWNDGGEGTWTMRFLGTTLTVEGRDVEAARVAAQDVAALLLLTVADDIQAARSR